MSVKKIEIVLGDVIGMQGGVLGVDAGRGSGYECGSVWMWVFRIRWWVRDLEAKQAVRRERKRVCGKGKADNGGSLDLGSGICRS